MLRRSHRIKIALFHIDNALDLFNAILDQPLAYIYKIKNGVVVLHVETFNTNTTFNKVQI